MNNIKATVLFILILSTTCINAQDVFDWEAYRNSLRNKRLERKENNVLKGTFLREMYVRDIANVCGDSIVINIPFDAHSPYDCGAPDCYSTDVSVRFKLGNTFTFPHEAQFTEHERGCVEQETQISGIFRLTGQTDNHVIYHSSEYGRILVLFRKFDLVHTWAYYFTNIDTNINEDSVTNENLYKIEEEHIEDGSADQLFPFKSATLNNVEYETFLD